MFGLGNNYVINQRQAPSIWESTLANFPTNFIAGRILIDNVTGNIYLDSSIGRQRISNGDIQPYNGLSSYGGAGAIERIGLGGSLIEDATIDLNNKVLQILGNTTAVNFFQEGILNDENTGQNYYPMFNYSTGLVVPDGFFRIINPITNEQFKVAVEKI